MDISRSNRHNTKDAVGSDISTMHLTLTITLAESVHKHNNQTVDLYYIAHGGGSEGVCFACFVDFVLWCCLVCPLMLSGLHPIRD